MNILPTASLNALEWFSAHNNSKNC